MYGSRQVTFVKNAFLADDAGPLELAQNTFIRFAKNDLYAALEKLVGCILQGLYTCHIHERHLTQSNHQCLRIGMSACQRMLEIINGAEKHRARNVKYHHTIW